MIARIWMKKANPSVMGFMISTVPCKEESKGARGERQSAEAGLPVDFWPWLSLQESQQDYQEAAGI